MPWRAQYNLCCQYGDLLPWAVTCITIDDTLCQFRVLSYPYDGDQVFHQQDHDANSQCFYGISDVELEPYVLTAMPTLGLNITESSGGADCNP